MLSYHKREQDKSPVQTEVEGFSETREAVALRTLQNLDLEDENESLSRLWCHKQKSMM